MEINLNIRANNRKKIFDFIKKYGASLISLYESLRNNLYWKNIEKEIRDYCKEKGVSYRIYFYHEKIRKNN